MVKAAYIWDSGKYFRQQKLYPMWYCYTQKKTSIQPESICLRTTPEIVTLTFSSLAEPKVVKLTTFDAACAKNLMIIVQELFTP